MDFSASPSDFSVIKEMPSVAFANVPFAQEVIPARARDGGGARDYAAHGHGLKFNVRDVRHSKTLLVPVFENNHNRAWTVRRRCGLLCGPEGLRPAGCRGKYS